jgi:hypothetical protein
MTRRTWASGAVLLGLLGLVLLAVLIAPSTEKGTPYSSNSAGLNGIRLARDLSARLGWKPEARETPFSDSMRNPAPVQIVIEADVAATEAHALLDFARRGGSLLIAGRGGALDDSLPLVAIPGGMPVPNAAGCKATDVWQTQVSPFVQVASIRWSRPAPPDTVGFGRVQRGGRADRVASAAVGFPYGAGRIVAVADKNYLANDLLRRCDLEADVSFVRMIEYLTRGQRGQRLAFDEFHHGYGVHGGSIAAIRGYLSRTSSGRMLGQLFVAGLLLLLAFAPRPLAPRDPSHVARRSPLEHADALAHAYAAVGATRTAASRLLAGVRRRSRRERQKTRDTDEQLLAAAAAMSNEAAAAAAVVGHALVTPVPARELPGVASALETIERSLTGKPTSAIR